MPAGDTIKINDQKLIENLPCFKGAATDMRYFARSKLSTSIVHKKTFSLL